MNAFLRVGISVLLVVGLTAGCAPKDPVQELLDERSRWNVELLSMAVDDEGQVTLSARLTGPVHSDLEQLTFRLEMYDAERDLVGHEWRTIDLTGVQRGGPEDLLLRIHDAPAELDSMAINLVLAPTTEESAFIEELQF